MRPNKIVLVDDDALIRRLIEQVMPPPEFQVFSFQDGRDALMRLHEIAPDLIIADIMMPEMDGRTFFQVVKRSQTLRHVPFLFLSAIQATDIIVATMEAGADDFVSKPFSPTRLLAKVRAVLRLAGRTAAYADDRRADQLSGELGPKGTLPLLKYCESVHLTGRLTVTTKGSERFVDFVGGELTEAGGRPEIRGEDPVDLLLSMTQGSYQITQRRLDPSQLAKLQTGLPEAEPAEDEETTAEGLVHLPGGKLTQLQVRGQTVTIQTEAENRPDFTVTTLIVRGGQIIRKIESAWPHPLQRRDDQPAAESQVQRQHERVAATVSELGTEQPTPAPNAPVSVDGGLLAWAVSFVAEQARDILGSVMTVTLLRRTYNALCPAHAVLRSLRPGNDGRVLINRSNATLPSEVVPAVAAWITAFLSEAGTMAEKAGRVNVRQATRMMEAELEKTGLYQALGPLGV